MVLLGKRGLVCRLTGLAARFDEPLLTRTFPEARYIFLHAIPAQAGIHGGKYRVIPGFPPAREWRCF
jgi:hypothetical protein